MVIDHTLVTLARRHLNHSPLQVVLWYDQYRLVWLGLFALSTAALAFVADSGGSPDAAKTGSRGSRICSMPCSSIGRGQSKLKDSASFRIPHMNSLGRCCGIPCSSVFRISHVTWYIPSLDSRSRIILSASPFPIDASAATFSSMNARGCVASKYE